MLKLISKKAKYLVVAVFAFIFSITALVIGAPHAKAATSYVDFSYDTKDNGSWDVNGEGIAYESTTGEFGGCNMKLADISVGDTAERTTYIKYKNQNGYKINKVSVSYPLNHMSGQNMDIYVSCGDYSTDKQSITTEMIANTSVKEFQLSGNSEDVYVYFIVSSSEKRRAPRLHSYYVYDNEVLVNTGYFVRIEYTASNTVSFDKNGGTGGTNSVTATYGEAMPSATMPTRTGYTFAGYYDSATGGTQYYTSTGASARNWNKTSDTTLYAHWTANTYTVTLNKNGGTGGTNSVTATYNSAMPAMTKPTRTGYTFAGYYDSATGGTQYYTSTGASARTWNKTSNATLYARWTANTYTVTLNKNDGTGGTNSVTATYDSAMPNATMPTKVGYDFLGYYDTNASTGGTQYYTSTGASARTWNKTSNTTLYARWQLKSVIQDVINKIEDIGTVSYPGSKTKINTARSAYDALSSDYQKLVSNYNTLTTAESTYETLRTNAISNTINLIDAIGEEVTYPDSKDAIVSAETAYSALDDADKSEITNYEKLTDARDEYNSQGAEKVNAVKAAINAINSNITYPESEEELTNANDLYNALDILEKPSVTNYSTLTGYNGTYATLREDAIKNVISLINAIVTTTPLVYPDVEEKINAARTAFDGLAECDQNETIVTNYQTLLDAEAVSDLVSYINNIGDVEDTDSFREKVSTARTNYNALTNDQKNLFPTDILKYLEDLEAIISVMNTINAIGDVEYTTESKGKIDTAQDAYDALDDSLKDSVANYDKLVQANTDYDSVDAVVKDINDIVIAYSSECKDAIDTARTNYTSLTDNQKQIFPEAILKDLVDYEKTYEAMDKINAIGTIENTTESKELVDTAKDYYDSLTEDQKALVLPAYGKILTNDVAVMNAITKVNAIGELDITKECKDKIDDAIDAYLDLTADQKALFPTDTYKTLDDDNKAKEAIDAIEDIGDVEYTPECKVLIDNANELYDNLTEDQKDLVFNYDKLVQANIDYDAVDEAVDKIDEIPDEFEYTDLYKETSDEANEYYDTLTEDQKAILPVDKFDKLDYAVKEYNVIDCINNIGKIENSKESKAKVIKAMEAYDALNEEQIAKTDTSMIKILTDSIAVWNVIDKVNEVKNAGYSKAENTLIIDARTSYTALSDDQKEIFPANTLEMLINIEIVYPLMVIINQLGKVEYTTIYKEKLDNAKVKFDALTSSQKELVRNSVVLSTNIQSYERIDNAVKAIDNIDKIKYNDSSKEAIEEANKQLKKLSEEERKQVPNEEKLIEAEKKYQKAEHSHNVGMGWVTAICIIFGIVIVATGLWLLILLILKKKREKEETNKKNSKKK